MEQVTCIVRKKEDLPSCLEMYRDFADKGSSCLVSLTAAQVPSKEFLAMVQMVQEAMPAATIIGSSSPAAISDGTRIPSGMAVCLSRFKSSQAIPRYFSSSADTEDIVENFLAWTSGLEDIVLIKLLIAGNSEENIGFLGGISALPEGLPVFGGIIDNGSNGDCGYVCCDGKMHKAGILAVAYCGKDLHAEVRQCSGWHPLGRSMEVTELENPYIVQKMDDMTVAEVYERYLGIAEGEDFAEEALTFPMVVKREDSLLSRLPLKFNSDGSALFGGDFKLGDVVQISYGDPRKIIYDAQDMQRAMVDFQPDGLMIVDCIGRYAMLQGDMNSELKNCRRVAPSHGSFSYCEIMRGKRDVMVLNMSFIIAGLREGRRKARVKADFKPDEVKLHRFTRSLLHLVHFVEMTTDEQKELNQRLAHMAATDALTQLLNRGTAEAELADFLQKMKERKTALSVIMLDVDNFKGINDGYGHAIGDAALRGVSDVIRKATRKKDSAGRWGGDEFFVMLRDAKLDAAKKIAGRIHNGALALDLLPDGRKITLSIGVTEASANDTLLTLFRRADDALYAAKSIEGKNSIVAREAQET